MTEFAYLKFTILADTVKKLIAKELKTIVLKDGCFIKNDYPRFHNTTPWINTLAYRFTTNQIDPSLLLKISWTINKSLR